MDPTQHEGSGQPQPVDSESPGFIGKYGHIQTERGKFHDGEPVFILRAADAAALETLGAYLGMCAFLGCSADHLGGIQDIINQFELWQHTNPELVKLPD